MPTGPGARVTSVFISLMDPSSNFLAADTATHPEPAPSLHSLHSDTGERLGRDRDQFPRMTEDQELS